MKREEEKQEKARELAIKYCKDIDPHGKEVYDIGCAIACCEMADWTDQHPRKGLWESDKVIDYIYHHAHVRTFGDIVMDDMSVTEFIDKMKKAMED